MAKSVCSTFYNHFVPSYIVDKNDSSSSPVVRSRYALEVLLSSLPDLGNETYSVPDLKADVLPLDAYGARPELHSQRQVVVLPESRVRKLHQQTRLPNSLLLVYLTCISNYDVLEEV